jgi:acyl-CoA thioester hydrolase
MAERRYLYELDFLVRDYECDMEGIVNNAVYQHYLEHTRHEFMHAMDVDFAKLNEEGKIPVVVRVEIDYKYPLVSRDRFVVKIDLQRQGRFKFVFLQDIYRLPDEQLILNAKVAAIILQNNRPVIPEEISSALERLEKKRTESETGGAHQG